MGAIGLSGYTGAYRFVKINHAVHIPRPFLSEKTAYYGIQKNQPIVASMACGRDIRAVTSEFILAIRYLKKLILLVYNIPAQIATSFFRNMSFFIPRGEKLQNGNKKVTNHIDFVTFCAIISIVRLNITTQRLRGYTPQNMQRNTPPSRIIPQKEAPI